MLAHLLSSIMAARQAGTTHPLDSIFSDGKAGAVFDPNYTNTMWQDAAMTVPVTADGDPVRVWKDVRGSGRAFRATSDALRPIYYSNSGHAKLTFNGSKSMRLLLSDGSPDLSLNLPEMSCFASFASTATLQVVVGWPHASYQVSPYFRNLIYTITDGFETRWNGVSWDHRVGAGWATSRAICGVSPANGRMYIGDGSYGTATVANPITYPNAVGLVLGANASGGEKFVGDIYGLCMFNRAAVPADVASIRSWLA